MGSTKRYRLPIAHVHGCFRPCFSQMRWGMMHLLRGDYAVLLQSASLHLNTRAERRMHPAPLLCGAIRWTTHRSAGQLCSDAAICWLDWNGEEGGPGVSPLPAAPVPQGCLGQNPSSSLFDHPAFDLQFLARFDALP